MAPLLTFALLDWTYGPIMCKCGPSPRGYVDPINNLWALLALVAPLLTLANLDWTYGFSCVNVSPI